MTRVERRSAGRAHLVESARSSLWLVPLLCMGAAVILGLATDEIDQALAVDPSVDDVLWSIEDARTLTTTLAPALLTFLGVVFSITIVALQLASQQYSPRLLRTFVRKPLTKFTLGVFLGTFVYSVFVLLSFDAGSPAVAAQDGTEPFVPAFSVLVMVLATLACLVVFVFYVHATVTAMQVSSVVEAITEETRASIRSLRPVIGPDGPHTAPTPGDLGPVTAEIPWPRRPGVLHGVSVPPLVELAGAHGTVLVLTTEIGTHVHQGLVVARQHGGAAVPPWPIAGAFDVGLERNLYQDPAYGLRQLVDVASRALSAAVNDPTTAIQALDRIEELLVLAAGQPDPTGVYCDGAGVVRVVRPVPSFARMATLGFTEIIEFGGSSTQVSRRVTAALDLLDPMVTEPADREVLDAARRLLDEHVRRHVADPLARVFALQPDRLGLG